MCTAALWARAAAHVYDPFLALGERRGMRRRRAELLATAHGRVLELGAGTGLNTEHYPARVDELVLSEPDAAMRARLQRRVARSRRSARVVDAAAETLPFGDDSFDTVVATLVLCTVADADAVVREIARVLRPGGRLLFIEHVRGDSRRLARAQHLLAGAWAAFAAGCRCDARTLELLAHSDLELGAVRRDRWRGMPAIVAPLVIGHATAREPAR